jgi:hypothetical protein
LLESELGVFSHPAFCLPGAPFARSML